MSHEDCYEVGGGTSATAVHRPSNNTEWLAWHADRNWVRHAIARVRVIDDGRIDETATYQTQEDLLQAFGLDKDSEDALLNRWT